MTPEEIDRLGDTLAHGRWERGVRLTDQEREALNHWTRWGSDGYPIAKLRAGKWFLNWNGGRLFGSKRAAVEAWEIYLAIFRRLSGLEAHERALAELEALR